MVAEKTAKKFRGYFFLPHPVHNMSDCLVCLCDRSTADERSDWPWLSLSTAPRLSCLPRHCRADWNPGQHRQG